MSPIKQFLRNWTLPIAMTLGALAYFAAASIPFLVERRAWVLDAVSVVQPLFIFAMLFITFCKVNVRELCWRPWHGRLLLLQCGVFVLLSLILHFLPTGPGTVIAESALLCLICPTATAAVVVTAKLNGDTAGLTAYTILINMAVAVLVPSFVPLVHPHAERDFLQSFFLIMSQVFPLLICPLFAALTVKKFCPKFHARVISTRDLAFRLWAVSLALAIAVSVRSIVHSDLALPYLLGIAAASLVCCIVQFAVGRAVGSRHGAAVSAGQSLGQKNTVFAIWMGYTYLTPVSAIAGGFYSVWHNVYNSWQLYRRRTAPRA